MAVLKLKKEKSKSNLAKLADNPVTRTGAGIIGGVFDIAGRPLEALVSGAAAVGPNSGRKGNKVAEYFKGVGRGLSGKGTTSLIEAAHGDLYGQIPVSGAERALDFGLQVALDPVTYTGVGLATKAKSGMNAIKTAEKARILKEGAEALPVVTKQPSPLLKELSTVYKGSDRAAGQRVIANATKKVADASNDVEKARATAAALKAKPAKAVKPTQLDMFGKAKNAGPAADEAAEAFIGPGQRLISGKSAAEAGGKDLKKLVAANNKIIRQADGILAKNNTKRIKPDGSVEELTEANKAMIAAAKETKKAAKGRIAAAKAEIRSGKAPFTADKMRAMKTPDKALAAQVKGLEQQAAATQKAAKAVAAAERKAAKAATVEARKTAQEGVKAAQANLKVQQQSLRELQRGVAVGERMTAKVTKAAEKRTARQSAAETTALADQTTALEVAAETGGKKLADLVRSQGTAAMSAEQRAAWEAGLFAARGEKRARQIIAATDAQATAGLRLRVPGTNITRTTVTSDELAKAAKILHLDEVAKAAQGNKGVQVLNSIFNGNAGLKREQGVERGSAVYKLALARENTSAAVRKQFGDRMNALMKIAGKLDADEAKLLQRMQETPNGVELAGNNQKLRNLHTGINKLKADLDNLQLEEGVIDPNKMHDSETYLKRMLTPEGRKALGQDKEFAKKYGFNASKAELNQGGALNLRKLFPDLTVQEINAKLEPELRASGALKEGQSLYHEGAIAPLVARIGDAADAVAESRYIDQLSNIKDADGVALLSKTARDSGDLPVDLGLKGKFFAPPEVAKTLEQAKAVLVNDREIKALSDLYMKWEKAWKVSATLLPVGNSFFARNARGNVFLNYLAGVTDPRDYIASMNMQKSIARAMKKEENLQAIADGNIDDVLRHALGSQDYEIFKQAHNFGVLNTSQAVQDLGASARKGVVGKSGKKAALGRFLGPEGKPVELGSKFNQIVEDNARLTHFIAKYRELGSFEEAAASVKKYLFDYGDLSPAEQKVFKRVMPFYTFMRKNTPLQLEQLITNPVAYTARQRAVEAATEAPDPEETPRYLADGRVAPRPLAALLGDADATFITDPDNPLAAATQALAPLIHTAGLIPGVQKALPEGFRAESGSEVAGEYYQTLGGPVKGLLDWLVATKTGVDPFTGNRISQDEENKLRRELLRAAKAATPAASRGMNVADTSRASILRNALGIKLKNVDDY